MRQWIDIISESFASPLPYKWTVKTDAYWAAQFRVADEIYFVAGDLTKGFPHPDKPDEDADWFDLSFGLEKDYFAGSKVIGTNGAAPRIFATVFAALREFLTERRPEFIMLSASKDNENRFRLYQKMAAKMKGDLAALGYQACEAPDHRDAHTARYFDTLAWRLT